MVSIRRGFLCLLVLFLCLLVLEIILLWHSLGLPFNAFADRISPVVVLSAYSYFCISFNAVSTPTFSICSFSSHRARVSAEEYVNAVQVHIVLACSSSAEPAVFIGIITVVFYVI